jgi:tetratricopeptide (TPR) repeat protein
MPPSEQARKYLDKANELAGRQQFNAAFAQFELAIRRQYGHAKAHADFGSALLQAGKYPEAIEQFRKAIEFNAAEPLDVHELTTAFSRDNRQEQDLAEFQNAVDKADRADLYHTWAQVLSALQRGDHAIEEFKKALAKDPELELNTELVAAAFNNSKNIEQHVAAFQENVDKLKRAHAWNTWGNILFRLRRHAAAAKQFEMAVSARDDWAEPYANLGMALIEAGAYEQAIEVLEKGLALGQPIQAYLSLGYVLAQIGEYEKAVSNYEIAASNGPDHNYFQPWLSSIRKLTNPDPAITRYRSTLDANNWGAFENEWSPYLNFGRFLNELGQHPDCAVYFGKSLALDANHDAASDLREVLLDIDERQQTLDTIQQIFDQVNRSERFVQWASLLARINEVDRAIQQFPKIVESLRAEPWHLNSLIDVVSALESPADRRRAQAEINELIRRTGDANLQVYWGYLLSNNLNDSQQALPLFKDLLFNPITTPGLIDYFATALQSSPSQSAAIAEIEAAVIKKANADSCYRWALILARLDKTKPAIEQLKRAIDLDKGHVDACNELGRLYELRGNYAKACQAFQKTHELDHERPGAIQDWGTALLRNGRNEEAIEKYAQAVRARADLSKRALASPTPTFVTPLGTNPVGGDLISVVDKLTWNDELIARFQKTFDEINLADSYREWGVVLAKIKRPDRAIKQFKKAVDLDPDSVENYSEWLKTIGTSGLNAQRLNEYEQALAKYRNNAGAYSDLADFLFRLKRNDEAAQRFQRAIELDPKDGRARAGLIYCLLAVNDLNAARQQARELLLHEPANDAVYNCLSWCAFIDGDYDEAIKQCELGVEHGHFYLYDTWARALFKSGREDLAQDKAQQAIEAQTGAVDPLYNFGALLMEMFRYEDAVPLFEKVVQLQPDHAYAIHNLAAIPFDKGRYEEAYGKWLRAIETYEKQGSFITRAVEQNRLVDSFEAYYHASLLVAIQHKHKEAEGVLKKGLDFDPNNTMILRALADLHWELKQELVGVDPDTNRRKSEFHWRGMEYFQRAEKLLKERSKRYPNHYVLIELGDLYLLHEDYEKARPCFEQARAKDDTAYVPYAKLGVIHLREREPEKAIPLLQEALKRNPDELDVKSSLAEAYLRAEKFDDAETTYRQVLAVAPNHVQSLIGLGELSSALGDKDHDRYSEATDHFTRAFEIAGREKIRSKYLKKSEEAAICYQLGYARVQSYESAGLRGDTKLLEQAKKDFDNCIARNPSHQKARRAKEKIDNRLRHFSRDWLTQKAGPVGILAMAVIVFVVVQAAFFLPLINQPSLIVSDRTLQAAAKQVPGAPVESLNQIKNEEFNSRKMLSERLQGLLPADGGKLVEAVMQHSEQVKRFENVPDMPAGYYALLTFGSLLFMVVGLYLPQILKLRVAGIELEKSSVDQAGAGGTLGISKL